MYNYKEQKDHHKNYILASSKAYQNESYQQELHLLDKQWINNQKKLNKKLFQSYHSNQSFVTKYHQL